MPQIRRISALFVCCLLFLASLNSQTRSWKSFPSYEEVVQAFFEQFEGSYVPTFRLEKRLDGYHIVRTNEYQKDLREAELFWALSEKKYLPLENFRPIEPEIPGYTPTPTVTFFRDEIKQYVAAHLRDNRFHQAESDRMPVYGYPGWYADVVKLLEPDVETLSVDELHSLARAYSIYSGAMLSNKNHPMVAPEHIFDLPPGQNALSADQLGQFHQMNKKAIDAYARLRQLDPDFQTPVGNIQTKYSNEIVDGFLRTLYFQNETAARTLLVPDLYDPLILQGARNMLVSCPKNSVLLTWGDTDTYAPLYVQAMEGLRTDVLVVNISLLQLPRYYSAVTKGFFDASPLQTLLPEKFLQETFVLFLLNEQLPPMEGKAFFKSLDTSKAEETEFGYKKIPLTWRSIQLTQSEDSLFWKSERPFMDLVDLAILDILIANNWERPVCISMLSNFHYYRPWISKLALRGTVYEIRPQIFPNGTFSKVHLPESMEIWLHKLEFVLQKPLTIGDRKPWVTSQRAAGISLAEQLYEEGDTAHLIELLEVLDQSFPHDLLPRDVAWVPIVKMHAELGNFEIAEHTGLQIVDHARSGKYDGPGAWQWESAKVQLWELAEMYKLDKLKAKLD